MMAEPTVDLNQPPPPSPYRGLLTNALVSMSDAMMAGSDTGITIPDMSNRTKIETSEPLPMPGAEPAPTATPEAATGPGKAVASGKAMTAAEVARIAHGAGFRGEALVTAVAIAIGESGLRPDAKGDTTITNEKWGPSVGIMQVRSLNAQRGKGTVRDELANMDPVVNLRAAFEISAGGTNFKPWTVYTKGIYKNNLKTARDAVSTLGVKD